jgi:hypothetical protein
MNSCTPDRRLELGSFCQKWGFRSSYVPSSTPLSKDRELSNEIRSALYLVKTSYGSHIHRSYLGCVSIVLINMLSDIFDILPISISKAASLVSSTSVAESYLVIRNWSCSTANAANSPTELAQFSPEGLGLDAPLLSSNWVRFAKNAALVLLMSCPSSKERELAKL